MKLASLLLHFAIAAALATALSLVTGHAALGIFGFSALLFLAAIAAHDYAPRTSLTTTPVHRVSSARPANSLRLAV